jgi:hypothetical protein
MATFTDSCIAKDVRGEPQIFRRGATVRLHAPTCPQIDGVTDTVRACFYQAILADRREHGLAVLLDNHSWEYCRNLETL